jgi:selenocysteine lyase/cysteine desulfurase
LNDQKNQRFEELKLSVYTALETYSNVHRGSGHFSLTTSRVYDQTRELILESLGLSGEKYTVIFCTPVRAEKLKIHIKPGCFQILSSQDFGLPLGVRAVVVEKNALPHGAPELAGGGTARLVSPKWVIWSQSPEKFEPGTPAIINIIAFARAMQLTRKYGKDSFRCLASGNLTAAEILFHDELEGYDGRELRERLTHTLIGRDMQVPTTHGMRSFINLDHAASTPTFEPVWKAVWQAWSQPEFTHKQIVQEVKTICSRMLNAPFQDFDVIFTSNTTESINLVAESFRNESDPKIEPVILNTYLEHNSNELPWRLIPGMAQIRLPVDAEGFMDLHLLESLLQEYNQDEKHGRQRITLVAVSGASNVLGTFNDLERISQIVHTYGAKLLVDAAQMIAHRKVNVEASGVDFLAFSAHKVYAPFGSGVLIARKELLAFDPEEMAQILSSGEENVGGIAALGKILLILEGIGMDLVQEEEQAITAQILRGLAQIPGIKIYGVKDPDSIQFAQKGGVIAFGHKSILPNAIARALAEQGGIGVRSGCHCAHLLVKRLVHISPFLEQFQGVLLTIFKKINLPGVVRVSLGIENTKEEIDTFLQTLKIVTSQPGNSEKTTNEEIKSKIENYSMEKSQKVYAHQ